MRAFFFFIVLVPFLVIRVSAGCTKVKKGELEGALCSEHKKMTTNVQAKSALVDAEAKEFYLKSENGGGYKKNVLGTVKIIFSFAVKDSAMDTTSAGWTRVSSTIDQLIEQKPVTIVTTGQANGDPAGAGDTATDDENLNSRYYLDSKALKTLPGAFWCPIFKPASDTDPGPYLLNIYWKEYYQEAMGKAETMVFLLTSGWFDSKNCAQELGWAAGVGAFNRKAKTNIFILLDEVAKTKFTADAKGDFAKIGGGTTTNIIDLSTESADKSPAALSTTLITKLSLSFLESSSSSSSSALLLQSSAQFKKKLRRLGH